MRIVEVLHTAAAAAVASFIIGTGSGVGASAQEIIAPDGSYPDGYNFSPEHRAGILAHSSIVLKNEKHHWLVFDGGIGKFKTEINGKNVIIPDLSGWTVAIDLNKSFDEATSVVPIFQHQRPDKTIPTLSRAAIWTDSLQDCIYISGGQFFSDYTNGYWNSSYFHLEKDEIPPYRIHRFCIENREWTDVTPAGIERGEIKRTFAGAWASVPNLNLSYHEGGIVTARSERDQPVGVFTTQAGMLVFDHTTMQLTNYTESALAGLPGKGHWHGIMKYLPIGEKGYLVAIMAERKRVMEPGVDQPYINDETGEIVDVGNSPVNIFDIAKGKWIQQETKVLSKDASTGHDDIVTSTRFCGDLVDNGNGTWDFWLFGGQETGEGAARTSVNDIFVLTMPKFVWVKITPPESNWGYNATRSHTCHAVNSQLIIIGGAPPEDRVNQSVEWNEVFTVFDMVGIGFRAGYSADQTAYRTPDKVQNVLKSLNDKPEPWSGWTDEGLRKAFEDQMMVTVTPPIQTVAVNGPEDGTIKGGLSTVAIVLIVVFSVIGVAFIILITWHRKRISTYFGMLGSFSSGGGNSQGGSSQGGSGQVASSQGGSGQGGSGQGGSGQGEGIQHGSSQGEEGLPVNMRRSGKMAGSEGGEK